MVKKVRADEEAVLVALQGEVAAIDDKLRACWTPLSTSFRILALAAAVTTGP